MKTLAALALTAALSAPIGCRDAATPQTTFCRSLGSVAHLHRLHHDHPIPLVVLGEGVWLCPCARPRRLAGDTERRKLGGDTEARHLGGDVEARHLGGDVEARNEAGDTENRRLGGDVEARRIGGDTEGRSLRGDVEQRRRAGDTQSHVLAGDVENRRKGGDIESRKLGGDAEERRLAGDTEVPACAVTPSCAGFVVYTASADVAYFDGWTTRPARDHCVLP